ncbi:MAG TPA: hypothetical protein VLC07_03210 [Solirubrobacterales bacterium]|nr:hypothetical protein [Solirubrobacterales bacterium]
MAERVPTELQASALQMLADPRRLLVSGITGEKRLWKALLKHGWVEPENPVTSPENGLRITPDGLRALAAALERYGRKETASR